MPSVSEFMTKQPWTISRRATLAEAHQLMREHGVRHLPVVDNGKLVGVVSIHDLHLLETIADFELDDAEVEEAMTTPPYYVMVDAPIDQVAEVMAAQKYGSVIVMDDDGVAGIFTYVDACRALTELVRRYTAMDMPAPELRHTGYSR